MQLITQKPLATGTDGLEPRNNSHLHIHTVKVVRQASNAFRDHSAWAGVSESIVWFFQTAYLFNSPSYLLWWYAALHFVLGKFLQAAWLMDMGGDLYMSSKQNRAAWYSASQLVCSYTQIDSTSDSLQLLNVHDKLHFSLVPFDLLF